MSESAETADDTAESSETEASETPEVSETSNEGSGNSGGDVGGYLSLNDAETEALTEWLAFMASVFGAIGIAQGLNILIQNQWNHNLVFTGMGFRNPVALSPRAMMTIGLFVIPLFGILLAVKVGQKEETPVKVAAAGALVSMPVLAAVAGLAGTAHAGGVSIDLINTIVSGLGAGIAAAIGAILVVLITQNLAPESLRY